MGSKEPNESSGIARFDVAPFRFLSLVGVMDRVAGNKVEYQASRGSWEISSLRQAAVQYFGNLFDA